MEVVPNGIPDGDFLTRATTDHIDDRDATAVLAGHRLCEHRLSDPRRRGAAAGGLPEYSACGASPASYI